MEDGTLEVHEGVAKGDKVQQATVSGILADVLG